MYSEDFPDTFTASRGKRAWAPNTLPVRRWHAWQWHIETRIGSPDTLAVSWPQLQEAVRSVMTCSPDYLVMGMSAVTFYGGAKGADAFQDKVEKEAGINIKSAKFWQGGFDVIARMISDLEAMETAAA